MTTRLATVLACVMVFLAGCVNQAQSPTVPSSSPVPPSAMTSSGKWSFDADQAGGLPSGAQAFSGSWAVRGESDAPSAPNALCQTGTAEFPAIMLDPKPYTDVVVVARFKPISGSTDRAAGLIFSFKDKSNYY